MNDRRVPDTIGVSLDTRENLRRASKSLTVLQLPGYKLTREIGRGSFGSVWQAVREGTGQSVAVKIVDQAEGLNWDLFRRELEFLREIEEHPHTLTVLDAQLENDPPYLVMPLAEGGSLEDAVSDSPATLKQVEKWMWQMTEALAFIHRKGVIHCDFKPSNVLLSSEGDVRIADLGQARRIGHELALGTIGFMSPEQCDEKTRSSPSVSWDVYGFGATVYWLLTGKIPRLHQMTGSTLEEYREAFQARPLVPIRQLNPEVDSDLAAIVESCLILDSSKRIPGLDAVKSDLERRRRHEPLHCRRPWKLSYITSVALKRRGVQFALALIVFVSVAGYGAWESRTENRFLTLLTNGIHAHESGRLEEAYLNWLAALDFQPENGALQQRLHFTDLSRLFPHQDRVNDLEVAEDGTLVTGSADGEVAFWEPNTGEKLASLKHPAHVSRVLLSPDGTRLATASWDGKARTFNLQTREPEHEFSHKSGDFEPSVTALAFCDKGKLLATADLQARVLVWDVETGEEKPLKNFVPNLEVRQVLATHPSKPILAALTEPGTIALWNMGTGEKLPFELSHAAEVNALAFSKDGRFVMSASDDHSLGVWDADTGRLIFRLHHEGRVDALIQVGERTLVSGCEDGTATLWDFSSGEVLQTFQHRRPVRSLAVDPGKEFLAVGTGEVESLWSDTEANGTLQVWALESGVRVGGPWPHDGPVEAARFGSQGVVYSGSGSARQTTAVYPGAARAWQFYLPRETDTAVEPRLTKQSGTILADGVRLPSGVLLSHGKNVVINAYSAHAKRGLTATASEDRTVRLWESATGEERLKPILLNGPAKAVVFSPGGDVLATAATDSGSSSVVRLWEVDTSYPATPDFTCPGVVTALQFSPDGKALRAFSEKGTFTWPLSDDSDRGAESLRRRLHARLNSNGEVVSEPILSETVMTRNLP